MSPNTMLLRMWRKRRLDPDTLVWVLAGQGFFVGIVALINPVMFEVFGPQFGLDVLATPTLWGASSIVLSAALAAIRPSRGKRWLMLLAVAFWTFVTASFILTAPYHPLIGSGFAAWSVVVSMTAYWRSWVWA